jgi:hypothetical protein
MKKLGLMLPAVLAALVVTAAPALAGNLKSYEGASWYDKYLSVSSGTPPVCDSNEGSLVVPPYGNNIDASHECGSQSETFIAMSGSNVIAGSNEIQRLPMRAMYSTDGGVTFTGVDLPLPPSRTNNGFDFGSDPGVAFDSQGNAYYSYIIVFFSKGGAINGTEMAVAHSTDHGAHWAATYFNLQTGEGQFNDKPMITVDTGSGEGHRTDRIYVAWDNATGNSSSEKNGNNVLLSYSDDHGASFSAPTNVSGSFTGKTGGIGADPYVTDAGVLHVAWQDYAHGVIADASSTDGGATFGPPHAIALVGGFEFDPPAQASRGALVYPACDSYGSALYCSYMDETNGKTTIYVAKSTDGGTSWTSHAVPSGGDQFNQWLAVDHSTGAINVAYYDTGTAGATSTLYTLARSFDGASWTAAPVANSPTDESCCAPSVNLGNQYGDYEGIAAADGIVRPVWTDRRPAVIALGLREEVFTATLAFPSP